MKCLNGFQETVTMTDKREYIMKRIIVIAAMMLAAVSAFAQNGKNVYEKYSGKKDVSAIYVSPSMFRMIGRIPDIHLTDGDVNLAPLIKSLDGLYLIDSTNPDVNTSMREDVGRFVSTGKYELMVEIREEDETVNIYTLNEGDIVKSFVFLAGSGDECTFICIDGRMPREELEKLIADAMKDGDDEEGQKNG